MIDYDIIRRPVQTEKSTLQRELMGQYTFEVAPDANRVQIKNAVEKVFSVKVASVKTLQIKGKVKQRGRIVGKRRDWKKAVVKLLPGQKIDFFEGM